MSFFPDFSVVRSYLSGMPELKLGLNDKLLFEASFGKRAHIERTASHESRKLDFFKQ